MPRRVQLAAVVAAGLAAAWWIAYRSLDYETPVELPTSGYAEYVDEDWIDIHVTRDGEVLFGGTPVTLDGLERRVRAQPKSRQILLCVDEAAPYVHFAWVCASVEYHLWGPDARVWLAVRRGDAQRVLDVRVPEGDYYYNVKKPPWWKRWGPFLPKRPANVPFLPVEVLFDGRFYLQSKIVNSRAELREHFRTELADAWMPVRADVGADIRMPYQAFIDCLNDLRDAGVEYQAWATARACAWVRRQPRLPQPDREEILGYWGRRDLASLTLPVALMAAEDKDDDPDDRLILNLDDEGSILVRGGPRSLDELGTVLSEAKRVYNLKMKAMGRSGDEEVAPGERWTKLFVLLRADRDTPWLHVQWILRVLEEERFYKVQFGVMKSANATYTIEESRQLHVPHTRRIPFVPWLFDAKLQSFLPTAPSQPSHRVRIASRDTTERDWGEHRVSVPSKMTYTVDGRTTESLAELVQWLKPLVSERKAVAIDAGPLVPLKYVVALSGCIQSLGVHKIDFVHVDATPSQRRLPHLPYPGTRLFGLPPGYVIQDRIVEPD